MKQEINPIFLILAIVLAVGLAIFVFIRATAPPSPPPGSYTPGVPPWMEKNKNGTQTQPGVRQVPSAQQRP